MAKFTALLLGVAVALVAAQQPQQPLTPPAPAAEPETRRPIIVDSLASALNNKKSKPQPETKPAAPVAPAQPASAGGFEQELGKLQSSIEAQKQTVDALTKQLEDSMRAKNRLMVAQQLMVAIISLKKAERVLGEVDTRIEESKNNIQKFGEQADDITENIKHSNIEHRRELTELNQKLDDLRASVLEQQKTLEELMSKRARIAGTVQRWKEHVATLRDAHEAVAAPEGEAQKAAPAEEADPLDVPEPPSSFDLGVLEAPPHDENSHVDAVAAGTTSNYDAAVQELAQRTFAELGQSRFAEAGLRGRRAH